MNLGFIYREKNAQNRLQLQTHTRLSVRINSAQLREIGCSVGMSIARYFPVSVQQALEKYNGDFAKTKAFVSEKLALSLTTLCDPTHQLAVCACVPCSRARAPMHLATPRPQLLTSLRLAGSAHRGATDE